MRYLIIIAAIILAGCQQPVDYKTGENCWRYGILDEGNTGRMISMDVEKIPVVKLDYDDLLEACDFNDENPLDRNLSLRACYKPIENTIYSYKLNLGKENYYITHERCHALLGREHNKFWGTGYVFGDKDNEWNKGVE